MRTRGEDLAEGGTREGGQMKRREEEVVEAERREGGEGRKRKEEEGEGKEGGGGRKEEDVAEGVGGKGRRREQEGRRRKGKEKNRDLVLKASDELYYNQDDMKLSKLYKEKERFGKEGRYPSRFHIPRLMYWMTNEIRVDREDDGREVLKYYRMEVDQKYAKYLQPEKKVKKRKKKEAATNQLDLEIISEQPNFTLAVIKLKYGEKKDFGVNKYGPIVI